MKFLSKIFSLSLVALLLFSLACCKKKAPQTDTNTTAFEQAMTAKDTTDVKNLVDRFFSFAKAGQLDEAAAMVYRVVPDTATNSFLVEVLNNEEMQKVKSMLTVFPVKDYTIEYIKFSESNNNEVLCRIIMREAEGDMPAMTSKMFFKPVNYLGNWVLCLTDTENGDKGLVDPDKRDSLENVYSQANSQSIKR